MRRSLIALACGASITACGDNGNGPKDAPATPHDGTAITPRDAAPDAPPDAPPDAACAHEILTGGVNVGSQGWTVYTIQPATLSYGSNDTQLATSTPGGGESGGQLLLADPNAIPANTAFKLTVVETIVSVNPHNQYDAAAAIMGSLTGQVGTQTERGEMIYLDANAIGWADDTMHVAETVVDGNPHTITLAVDAANNATVTFDGAAALSRANFVTNGTVAVGDQTNDANVDATTQIRSVVLSFCP